MGVELKLRSLINIAPDDVEDDDKEEEEQDSLEASPSEEMVCKVDVRPEGRLHRLKSISEASTEYRRIDLSMRRRFAFCSRRVGAWLFNRSDNRERRGAGAGEMTLFFSKRREVKGTWVQ